jgi:hypothetical protein
MFAVNTLVVFDFDLRSPSAGCKHCLVVKILTVRLSSALMAKVDRKAALLGRRRVEHVRQILAADVAEGQARPKRFAILPLKGRHAAGRGSDNAAVRRALAQRAI